MSDEKEQEERKNNETASGRSKHMKDKKVLCSATLVIYEDGAAEFVERSTFEGKTYMRNDYGSQLGKTIQTLGLGELFTPLIMNALAPFEQNMHLAIKEIPMRLFQFIQEQSMAQNVASNITKK